MIKYMYLYDTSICVEKNKTIRYLSISYSECMHNTKMGFPGTSFVPK